MDKKENLIIEYIYQAFYELLKTNSYDKISVSDISTKAGVSRMSFYRNFASKEDLLFKSTDKMMNNFEKRIKNLENPNEYNIIKELFETFLKCKPVMKSFTDSPAIKTMLVNSIDKIKERMSKDYMNKSSKYIPIFYFSAITLTVFEWLRTGAVETTDEMARLIISLIDKNNFHCSKSE